MVHYQFLNKKKITLKKNIYIEYMDEFTIPNSIKYELPSLPTNSKNGCKHFPSEVVNGIYSGDGSRVCRIPIDYNGMIDFSKSYLSFLATNNTTKPYSYDLGQPLINRLRLIQNNNVLEDIENYNSLVGGILLPANGGRSSLHANTLNSTYKTSKVIPAQVEHDPVQANNPLIFGMTSTAPTLTQANGFFAKRTATSTIPRVSDDSFLADGTSVKMGYRLVSGLLNSDKYYPAFLQNQPLILEITFAGCNESGVRHLNTDVIGTLGKQINISNVKYVAHTIDLDKDYYNRLRMVQQQTGGVIQISGVSFCNSIGDLPEGVSFTSVPLPFTNFQNIKSIVFKCDDNTSPDGAFYKLSGGNSEVIQTYQLDINGVSYPPKPVTIAKVTSDGTTIYDGKSEAFFNLQLALGKLGSTIHNDLLANGCYLNHTFDGGTSGYYNYNKVELGFVNPERFASNSDVSFAPFGLDLESWKDDVLGGGVNTNKESPNMNLKIDRDVLGHEMFNSETARILVWAMYDILFYISLDGTISTSK